MSFQNWQNEFDKFWPEHSKVSLVFTLMGFFWLKYILLKLKRYVGFIFHETEEGYKIWSGNNLSFQNWHKEFEKFSSEHLKVSNCFTLMGFFWAKYILFKLKMYIRVIFHETEEGCKVWRGIDLSFQNWHKEFDKFWPEHSKVSLIFTLMRFFWAKCVLFKLN